jgi:hypothetical protein
MITARQGQALELAMANYISLFSAILIIIGSIDGARSLAAAAPMRSSRGQLAALQQQRQRQQLQIAFYEDSCPNLHSLVLESMRQAASQDLRAPASILRLFFHDCFVQVRPNNLATILESINRYPIGSFAIPWMDR